MRSYYFSFENADEMTLSKICILKVKIPGGPVIKNLPIKAGDMGLIPGLGRSLGGGHGNPIQYSPLENPQG